MSKRIKDKALPYPENIIKAMNLDENINADIDALYDIVRYKTTPPNKELLLEYFKENMKMSDIGKLHNLSTERIRQKINLSLWDIKRYVAETIIDKEITWHIYEYPVGINNVSKSTTVNAPYMLAETSLGIFTILPYYSSHAQLKYFSIWYQTPDMRIIYGKNYGINLRTCSNFENGQKLIKNFYNRMKENNNYKNLIPRSPDPNMPIPDPFDIHPERQTKHENNI